MKLHFESNLDYQLSAIEAVCDLFRGQEICRTEFTVTQTFAGGQAALALESDLGIGNRLQLLDDEILANLKDVQLRNGLRPSESLTPAISPWKWRPEPARRMFTRARSSS
jgi:type III restriction enzyme